MQLLLDKTNVDLVVNARSPFNVGNETTSLTPLEVALIALPNNPTPKDCDIIRLLLESGASPNGSSEPHPFSPLSIAIDMAGPLSYGVNIVRQLVDAGADPTYDRTGNGCTPLYRAVEVKKNLLPLPLNVQTSSKYCGSSSFRQGGPTLSTTSSP